MLSTQKIPVRMWIVSRGHKKFLVCMQKSVYLFITIIDAY